ncbi:MAG: TRAP transporter substrate-binding protein [Salinisphaera sp.]|jgi:tripartite ATP-independent transporter DctP family solute receptor|nr:TRAP transporter substrate-binding protein [Salinisphaera sp.]
MNHKIKKWLPASMFCVVMTLIFTFTPTEAFAAHTVRLGWTTADSKVDPYAITAHLFAKELNTLAPGQFDVKFYPNHELGNDTDMFQALQLGTLDAGVITGALIGNFVPAFQLNDLPFLYASTAQAHKVLDGPVGQALMAKLKSKGIVGVGFAEAGFRNVINNVRPIRTPSDLHGIKLRVQPTDLFIASFRALGANAVPIAWSDAYTAVQQGTVDGLEIPLPVIYANKYAEVTKYLSLTRHAYNALGLLMSAQTFNGLSAKQQAIVQKAAHIAIRKQRAEVEKNNAEILTKLEQAGMKVNKVKDIKVFRAKVNPVYKQYRTKIGPKLVDLTLKEVSQ